MTAVWMRILGLIVWSFMAKAYANPLDLSLETWDLKIADDPLSVQELIDQHRTTIDPEAAPAIYLRVLSMDCLVRAQSGAPLPAENIIDAALQNAKAMSAWDEAILLTSCKARIRIKAGQHHEGVVWLEEAVARAEKHEKSSLHIRILVLLSNFYLSNNEQGKALALLQNAQSILESDRSLGQIERERLKVEVTMGLESTGTHNVGVEIYESALQYFIQAGLRSYQVIMHYNLAESFVSLPKSRDLNKARFHYQAAANLALSLRDEMTYVYALAGVAKVEYQLKNFTAAEKLMMKAIDAFKDKDFTWWAESLETLAAIKKEQGRHEEALEILKKAESILPEAQKATKRSIQTEMEDVLVKLGRFQDAYALRKELSEAQIATLKNKAAQEYSKLKVDLGLSVEEERATLLQKENERQKKISYYKTIATLFLGALILVLIVFMIWLKVQRDRIRSMQKHIQENVLQRFLPPQIIDSILSGQSPLDEAAQEATVTILFCDLVDFTSSSERLGADKIARVLNQFFKEMTEEIFDAGGTIDKFIGDAIMVLFGAPIHAEAPIQAQKAFECAERILKRMNTLNEQWRLEEGAEFAIRIGVHQGQAIVGSFGSQKRSDYTAIGLHVNIAARIETAAMPNTIYFSESIARHLPADRYTALGPFRLRGVSEELDLFTNTPGASDRKCAAS
ncbi:MAG TPA: adenylate/guanylate cyclase domain-containing protein [Oligoflexus sp.]|uniref:adenylate/guanylate cyclase domain-containing protein n=1 Tax=Oligoflexus sp. TaxID=1971216 RepID=UPI002D80FD6A|nr:adenylate/guanylate cyclase domain-containing protein [Oligoflexus sp.]HET9238997.1 adenylate/guanylate cyclase domain-containing protein [Oligoflexus sp.]